MTFVQRLANLGFASYDAYLHGEHWQEFKQKYRASGRPMRCAACGGGPIQLHHHNYERLGRESLHDITPLCGPHHEAVHNILKANTWFVQDTEKAITIIQEKLPKASWKKIDDSPVKDAAKRRAINEAAQRKLKAEKKARKAAKREERTKQSAMTAEVFRKFSEIYKELRDAGFKHPLVPLDYVPEMVNLARFVKYLNRIRTKQAKDVRREKLYAWKNKAAKHKPLNHDFADPLTVFKAISSGFRAPKTVVMEPKKKKIHGARMTCPCCKKTLRREYFSFVLSLASYQETFPRSFLTNWERSQFVLSLASYQETFPRSFLTNWERSQFVLSLASYQETFPRSFLTNWERSQDAFNATWKSFVCLTCISHGYG